MVRHELLRQGIYRFYPCQECGFLSFQRVPAGRITESCRVSAEKVMALRNEKTIGNNWEGSG
jgi:hypothetical protein